MVRNMAVEVDEDDEKYFGPAPELRDEMDFNKAHIRALIGSVYDIQKMRISAGNRIVSSYYLQQGIDPKKKLDEEAKKIIEKAKKGNKNVTEGVVSEKLGKGSSAKSEEALAAERNKKKDKLIGKIVGEYKEIAKEMEDKNQTFAKTVKSFEQDYDRRMNYIRSELDYRLVKSYMILDDAEEEATKALAKQVYVHPMWDAFFKNVRGCGPLIAGVCMAYLDPRKAPHVSCFYRYAGLDTVQDEDKDGNPLFYKKGTREKVRVKYSYVYEDGSFVPEKEVKKTGEVDEFGEEIFRDAMGEICKREIDTCTVLVDGEPEQAIVYEDPETLEQYVGEVAPAEHGRNRGDTELRPYIDKNGEAKLKKGLTYNPTLKSKLMGVLTGCLLKSKDPKYSAIYYDYKKRLSLSPLHDGKSDMVKHKMAMRYMIKQLLRDMWTTWRDLLGLEVDEPYEVAKLGNRPHKYNEYQVKMAEKYGNSSN